MGIVVIAPHPDDEAIGCGGAICVHAARGERVVAVFLTSGELGLPEVPPERAWQIREGEAEAVADILGLAALAFLRHRDWYLGSEIAQAAISLAPILAREAPELIYVPHPREWHPDHQAAGAVVQAALQRAAGLEPAVRAYEIWTPLAEYDWVEDVTPVMARKLRAIRRYRSQRREFAYDRAARGLNEYRGALAGHCRYAEVFGQALKG